MIEMLSWADSFLCHLAQYSCAIICNCINEEIIPSVCSTLVSSIYRCLEMASKDSKSLSP